MALQRRLVSIGAGLTTFLVVGAAVMWAVEAEIGAGILGVFAGLFAAMGAAAAVYLRHPGLGETARRVAAAYAAFGYAFFTIWFLRYGHVAHLDDRVDMSMQMGLSIVVAVSIYVGLWAAERSEG